MKRTLSTHIRGHGYGVFRETDGGLHPVSVLSGELTPTPAWVRKTTRIIEGVAESPYIHLDIRTPFGESVEEHAVDQGLAESLGPKRDRFNKLGWHIYFVEDTNLGSNHRIFVDLEDAGRGDKPMEGADFRFSLEPALEALATELSAQKGTGDFQLILSWDDWVFSVLFLEGDPYHILRLKPSRGETEKQPRDGMLPSLLQRLKMHRDYGLAQAKIGNGNLRTFVCPGEPLLANPETADLEPEIWNPGWTMGKEYASSNQAFIHFGLALASGNRDLARHNRLPEEDRKKNRNIRTLYLFYQAMAGMAIVCALVVAAYGLAIYGVSGRLAKLQSQSEEYRQQVSAIKRLRAEKSSLESALNPLRPVWSKPINWARILDGLDGALPPRSGLDGIVVNRQTDGTLDLSFRVWVKEWNDVTSIQEKLMRIPSFKSVELSEQRRDIGSNTVVFHVKCRIGKI